MNQSPDNLKRDSDPSAEFVSLLTECQFQLHLSICSLVSSRHDAEDIRQETNQVLWRKREEFVPGTNFTAWAKRVAYLEVLKFRGRQPRERPLLSENTLALLSQEMEARSDLLELRQEFLPGCLEKLVPRDLELIDAYYQQGEKVGVIAGRLGRSASSVRHSISRIRRQLKQCIDAAVARENGQ